MLYACDICHYLFLRTSEDTCPDCGKAMIRPALLKSRKNIKIVRKKICGQRIQIAAVVAGHFTPAQWLLIKPIHLLHRRV